MMDSDLLFLDNLELLYDFELSDIYPVSTNDMYFSRPKRSKKNPNFMTTYTIRTPALKSFQSDVAKRLEESIDKSLVIKLSPTQGLFLFLILRVPKSSYLSEDSSNYIKAYEDCISKYLGIDDRYNLTVMIHKVVSLDDTWGFRTKIYIEDYDTNYLLKEDSKENSNEN